MSAVLNVYEYKADSSTYTPAGKSGLLKTACNLHINVSHLISNTKEGVRLDHTEIPDLIEYIPYHLDLDICQPADLHNVDTEQDEDTDPYIVERIVDK